ncbi:hydrogenase maturation protease [Nocardia sp. NBC_01730]|uniref:hydrogenase maturation protease n=1 Tax=Nocardia sp. NBC_01730 TaxID=2975998 RepID=UPI002E15B13D|nr:hydrogenase maturation protease [Nocardia sp. NBC_01730]
MTPPHRSAVVIGLGNQYRGDDAVGPTVVSELQRYRLPNVELTLCDGEPVGLLEAWSGVDLAILVDAVLCEPSDPGRIWLSTMDNLHGVTHSASSHTLGVPEALLLGRALDRIPGKLIVVAVEAANLDLGLGLSAPVAAAVPRVVETVLDELAATKTDSIRP